MAHHLLVFDSVDTAQRLAGDLADEGFASVTARQAADGSGELAIDDHRLPISEGSAAVEGLRDRFQALADEHGGQYVESQPGEAGVREAARPAAGTGGGTW